MVVQIPVVLYSGGHYPRGFRTLDPNDTVPGTDTTAQASGNAALVLAGTALASGNAGLVSASNKVPISGGYMTGQLFAASGVVVSGTLSRNGFNVVTVGDVETVTSTMIASGTIIDADVNISGAINATKLRFLQAGASGVARTVDSKLKDTVSVKDFGAVGDGVTDDTAAIQAAVNTGKSVFLPNGIYKLFSPITLSTVGQRFFGESSQETYLTGGLNHDQLRIAGSQCEVDHVHFRPDGSSNAGPPTFAPLRIYAALAHVHDNRFLAASSGSGTAIYLDDVNPATSAVIAGAYTHTIAENKIGATTYEFKYGVYAYNNNNGQQATKIQNNQFMSDNAITITKGGGNYYVGNLLQSNTGTYLLPVGTAIAFLTDVLGETVTGNYIERYQYGVSTSRAVDQYLAFNAYGNHYDNVTNTLYSTATLNYTYFDEISRYHYINSWQHRYDDQNNYKFINREGIEVWNVNRASASFEPRIIAFNNFQSLSYTSNNQTLSATSSLCEITGAGAARTGCFLGNGSRTGQTLYLRGATWSVQILNNPGGTQNIMFDNSAASATFGSGSGQVQFMLLVWDSTYGAGRWFEVSRTLI